MHKYIYLDLIQWSIQVLYNKKRTRHIIVVQELILFNVVYKISEYRMKEYDDQRQARNYHLKKFAN